MTVEWLGCQSFDEMYWKQTAESTAFMGHALLTNYGPLAVDGIGRGSRMGVELALPNIMDDGFLTRDKDWVSYILVTRANERVGTAATSEGVLHSHPTGGGAANGTVRMAAALIDATTFRMQIEYKDAGTWTLALGSGAGAIISIATGNDQWVLQIDKSAGTGDRAQILRNGSVYDTWRPVILTSAQISGTPGMRGPAGKAANWIAWHTSAYATVQGDSESDITDASIEDFDVLANYPNGDGDVENWTPTNNAAGACVNQLWRTLDDAEDDDDQSDDYISESEAGEEDALFDVTDQDHASATIECVTVVAIGDVSAGGSLDNLIAKLGGTTATADKFTVTTVDATSWAHLYTGIFQQAPGGLAWTKARFNDCFFGVRSDAGNSGKVYGLIINTIGKNLSRPTQATACPAPTGQRRLRGCVV